MVQPVIQRTDLTPQLISRRKVGRPERDRPVREPDAPDGQTGKKSSSRASQQSVALYDLDVAEGIQFRQFVPTGQYLDTYA